MSIRIPKLAIMHNVFTTQLYMDSNIVRTWYVDDTFE